MLRRNNSYELRAQSDGEVMFRVWIDEEVETLVSESAELETGTVHHLAGTYDGSDMRIYVNGAEAASQAQEGAITHDNDSLFIGRNDFSNTYFDGTIDDVAIDD